MSAHAIRAGLPGGRRVRHIFLAALIATPALAIAGAECDGTVVPGRGFVKAGSIYKVTRGGATYLCVACGSCRAMPSASSSGAGGGASTRGMIGGAVFGGFMSGFQQGLANAQAEREAEAARKAARREADRISAEREEAERRKQFEQTKQQTLGALKGFASPHEASDLKLKSVQADPASREPPALRDARCAAEVSATVRAETSGDGARTLAEHAMQGAGAVDCSVPEADLPEPTSERLLSPENATKVKVAEDIVLQLSRNGQSWSEAHARREAALERLQRAREEARTAQLQPSDGEAQRKAQAALAAAARLEQELADIERTMQNLEQGNQQLMRQLADLERGDAAATARPSPTPASSSSGATR